MKEKIRLGEVQETLLVPLYARAMESRRKRPILRDSKAAEMVDAIDWDYQRFGQRLRIVACTLRCSAFDKWVAEFLRLHPDATVVEIGAGLNTRFERLDNGRVHWFDLDLPDVVELRRRFFQDSERRTTLAGSVVDADWVAAVQRSPGPYLFVAETVLVYLNERDARAALTQIAGNFPGATIAFDTCSPDAVRRGNKDFVRRKMAARFDWACEDPRDIEGWNIGLHLVKSHSFLDASGGLQSRVSWWMSASFRIVRMLWPKVLSAYRLNLFERR
jgi:O-methyltransferase involved in polyketide biosynthesis